MPHGVDIDLEITFNQVSSSAKGISFFSATISDGQKERYLQIRNLSFDGFNANLTLPNNKGIYSDNLFILSFVYCFLYICFFLQTGI